MTLAIPARWTDVTPGWMTAALAARFDGIDVRGVDLVWHTDGSNRRARFALDLAGGDGPPVVFVKAEGEHREVHARNGNLFNEPRLLASGVPLPLEHPEPYAVVIDESGLDWLVVLEDVALRGADPWDATRPMTPAQATSGVLGLARLHRTYWQFTAASHPALAWVQTWAPTEGFQHGLRRRIPTGLVRAAAVLPAELDGWTVDDVLGTWARYVGLLARDPVTLLHADTHVGNTYVLPGDEVGFLDWQVARRGNWSQDVGHFLQGALVPADRRAHERAVVEAYVAELDRDLDGEEAWLWYRASAAYGLAIWLSTLGTEGYQPHEVSLALSERFAAALVDLDGLEAIATLERRAGVLRSPA